MALKLRVAFTEKEEAKRRGALWSVTDKTWFAPPHLNYNQFAQWVEAGEGTVILQAPYYVATSSISCWKCTQLTTVAALAADSYCILDYEESESDEANEDDAKCWYRQQEFAFVSAIDYIDAATATQLAATYPYFRFGHSHAGGSYWANHCQQCQALQGDFFLHQEPGGPFSPTTVEECQRITLETQPTTYDCIISAGVNWSSFDAQVPRYAQRRRIAQTVQ